MPDRRDFIGGAAAFAAASGLLPGRLCAQDRYDQAVLLAAEPFGNLTLCHLSDLRGQFTPHYQRPPDLLPKTDGAAPALGAEEFRVRYGIGGANPMDYALTAENFAGLAEAYGPMGGLAQVATILGAIRRDRPGALLLMGGETVRGSYLGDVAGPRAVRDVIAGLGPDAVSTGDDTEASWALPDASDTPSVRHFDREGIGIAVIGHVPMSAGDVALRELVSRERAAGARCVVWLSGNGIAADRAVASQEGIDLILSSGHHDALPEPIIVGGTRIVASGGQGRFVSRLDLEVTEAGVADVRQILIPVFSDLIAPAEAMGRRVKAARAPYIATMTREVGRAGGLLYRRGLFESPWDAVHCAALMRHYAVPVALVPGYRWGRTVLAQRAITPEDLHALTSGGPGGTRVVEMTGQALRDRLEAAAEAVFGAGVDRGPRLDMPRWGGLSYTIEPGAASGARIRDIALLPGGGPPDPATLYPVALWEGETGPRMVDLLESYIRAEGVVAGDVPSRVTVI